jgi:hypothetical protein
MVNKNPIKTIIGGPPGNFFLKALTPRGILAKTSATPSPGFLTCVHLCRERRQNETETST